MTITIDRAVVQQALEALENSRSLEPVDIDWVKGKRQAAIRALKAALEQPEQEPVAWTLTETLDKRETTTTGYLWFSDPQNSAWTPLYTHLPRREWRSLSEDELTALGIIHSRYQEESLETGGWFDFARAIEAALKERNA